MALIAPQYNDQKLINLLRSVNNKVFYVITVCSLWPLAVQYLPVLEPGMTLMVIANIIFIILYFSLDFIVEYHLYPLAEDARKADFIDNSWGTKYALENSVKYYDNDELPHGLYKMSVNLFENVFFSLNVSRAMRKSKLVINLFFAVIILVIAFYGFKNVPLAIPLLQVVFSSVIFGDLIKYFVFMRRMKQVIERWQALFQVNDFKSDPDKYRAQVYTIWLYYESTLARTQISLSEAKFNALNQKLTHKWEEIKKQYFIS